MVAALVGCGVPLWFDGGGFALRPGPGGSRWRSWLGRNAIRPAVVVSGWLPRGIVSIESLMDTVRRACAEDWAKHPNCCAMSVDYPTGRRVAFGRIGLPRIAASAARVVNRRPARGSANATASV